MRRLTASASNAKLYRGLFPTEHPRNLIEGVNLQNAPNTFPNIRNILNVLNPLSKPFEDVVAEDIDLQLQDIVYLIAVNLTTWRRFNEVESIQCFSSALLGNFFSSFVEERATKSITIRW